VRIAPSTHRERNMVQFKREQIVYTIGGVEIGGRPGERPMVLVGSIFFSKHRIVTDPERGLFDEAKARELLEREAEMVSFTGNRRIIDPIGDSAQALIRYIDFVAKTTDAPILVDSPMQTARIEALKHFAGTAVMERLVYNSIAEDCTEDELETMRLSGIKSAVLLAFSTAAIKPKDRLAMLREKLIPAAQKAGIENILVDTGVLDVASVGWAAQAISVIKDETGYPTGCAPANALFQWEKMRRRGESSFQAAAASVFSFVRAHGADFIFYGPMRFAPWVYPACAAFDGLAAYGGRFTGIRAQTEDHPVRKIF